MSDDPKRQEALEAARLKAYDLLVYDAGMSDEEEGLPVATINAVAATLLAWGRKEREAALREAAAKPSGYTKRYTAESTVSRNLGYVLCEELLGAAGALEAEGKES